MRLIPKDQIWHMIKKSKVQKQCLMKYWNNIHSLVQPKTWLRSMHIWKGIMFRFTHCMPSCKPSHRLEWTIRFRHLIYRYRISLLAENNFTISSYLKVFQSSSRMNASNGDSSPLSMRLALTDTTRSLVIYSRYLPFPSLQNNIILNIHEWQKREKISPLSKELGKERKLLAIMMSLRSRETNLAKINIWYLFRIGIWIRVHWWWALIYIKTISWHICRREEQGNSLSGKTLRGSQKSYCTKVTSASFVERKHLGLHHPSFVSIYTLDLTLTSKEMNHLSISSTWVKRITQLLAK